MNRQKILCIDDNPDEIIESSQLTLDATLKSIFADSKYNIIFAINGDAGLKAVREDNDIKLVLLDVMFVGRGQTMQGPEIANKLNIVTPEAKVIVLTNVDKTGKKISFGKKPNVVGYVIKKKIADDSNSVLLRNLSEAVMVDPLNERWTLRLDTDKRKITLLKENYSCHFTMRSERRWLLLEACANNPNEFVNSYDIEGFLDIPGPSFPEYVYREVYAINNKVLDKAQWRTWGMLHTDHNEKSSAKLVIGKVEIDQESIVGYKRPLDKRFVTTREFEEFKKDFETFKNAILSKLEEINDRKRGC